MRTVPESSPRMAEAVWLSCSALLRRLRTAGMSRSPSFVSFIPERFLRSSAKPSSFSRLSMLWLTADCVHPSSSAALVRLPVSTTAASVLYFSRLICFPPHYYVQALPFGFVQTVSKSRVT